MKFALAKILHLAALLIVSWKLTVIKCQMLLLELSLKR